MSEIDEATDAAALIEAYYEAGWTDGLPEVPPSDASIAAMMAAAGLDGHAGLRALPGRNAIVHSEQAATKVAMAGNRHPYLTLSEEEHVIPRAPHLQHLRQTTT